MEEIKVKLNEQNSGAFLLLENGEQLGEMVMDIKDHNLTVYHTEVDPKAEGRGFAKKLLTAMVDYARQHQLNVVPLCPFVHAQFRRHPAEYADLWKGEEAKS